RDLHHHRQAAAEWVHLVGPVELHRFPLQALRVAFVLRPQGIDLRLEHLHRLHRRHALDGQREEEDLRDHGEQDDGHTVVMRELVEAMHQPQDGYGQPLHRQAAVVLRGWETTEIYVLFQTDSDRLQAIVLLGADIALDLAFPDLTGLERRQGNSQPYLADLHRLCRVRAGLANLGFRQEHPRTARDDCGQIPLTLEADPLARSAEL